MTKLERAARDLVASLDQLLGTRIPITVERRLNELKQAVDHPGNPEPPVDRHGRYHTLDCRKHRLEQYMVVFDDSQPCTCATRWNHPEDYAA